ncbi:SLATT domain-containing protein [Marinobacter sp. M1N3S26]|uniref:SLATT domain-containing protein n=1 Tax=Marinobacter sp. M1N3S26 TaxID=3382299 RepID=UPI00387B7E86
MDGKKLVEIANLEVDCKIGKDRHFIAADRKNRLRIFLGLFAVIGSAAISSGINENAVNLVGSYSSASGHWESWSQVLSRLLPLLVGISTAVIGFLGLEKQTAQHRYVGNEYIEIARKARSLLNSVGSRDDKTIMEDYDNLLHKYLEVNKEGESCPTNDADSHKAMKMNALRRTAIKAKISAFEKDTLNLESNVWRKKAVVLPLHKAVFKQLRFCTAVILLKIRLIRRSDYRKYLKELSVK